MAAYKGTITTTGSSEAIRFDKALFRQHPEFRRKANVKAHVIAPGYLLVSLDDEAPEQDDPVLDAFLAFVANDIASTPARVSAMSSAQMHEVHRLTAAVEVDDEEILPDDVSF